MTYANGFRNRAQSIYSSELGELRTLIVSQGFEVVAETMPDWMTLCDAPGKMELSGSVSSGRNFMEKADISVNINKNVNWMETRGFWTFYVLVIGMLYMAMPFLVPANDVWTAVNVVHGLVSFGIMHWIKGSPDDSMSMGDYRELTFYEQIDEDHPWSGTKKFLIVVPTVIFMLASVTTDYDTHHLMINFPIWFVLILAKLPEFHRVRIFGINSTVGIDDEVIKDK